MALNVPYDEVQKVLNDCPRTEAELFNDWGCGLAKTGRIAGLYVLLNAGTRKDLPGLESFEQYSGMNANRIAHPENFEERFKADQAWLTTNENNMVWDQKEKHFILNAKK